MTNFSFNPSVEILAASLLSSYVSNPRQQGHDRFLVSISGVPGSGKSTLAEALRIQINEKAGQEVCCLVPMDGFHLSKSVLNEMSDPAEAHRRRGAPFTFDPEGLLRLVKAIKSAAGKDCEIVSAPGWSHSLGDPLNDAIEVKPWY
jgi:pantothenate kinase